MIQGIPHAHLGLIWYLWSSPSSSRFTWARLLELSCCKNRQKSLNPETGLGNRGYLKVLNATKLILSDKWGTHLGTIWYRFVFVFGQRGQAAKSRPCLSQWFLIYRPTVGGIYSLLSSVINTLILWAATNACTFVCWWVHPAVGTPVFWHVSFRHMVFRHHV